MDKGLRKYRVHDRAVMRAPFGAAGNEQGLARAMAEASASRSSPLANAPAAFGPIAEIDGHYQLHQRPGLQRNVRVHFEVLALAQRIS